VLTAPKAPDHTPTMLDDAEQLITGVFEPPSSATVATLARRKWFILVVALLGAVAGIAYGTSRAPTYTASATLQVGQVNPNSAGFLGYVQSAASLATAFSRSIEAEPVLAAVHAKLGLTVPSATSRLSAEPIPSSPAFRVIATGPTADGSIRLANIAASAVVAYENQSNNTNPEATSLLREYREASLALHRAVAHLAAHAGDRHHEPAATRALAEAEKSAAAVNVRAIEVAYTNAISARAPSSGLVSQIAGATSASSNHKSQIELTGFVGLLAGVVLGCVIAILRGRHRSAMPATTATTQS
jgi:capsular polysaccharide biosynthesis protein